MQCLLNHCISILYYTYNNILYLIKDIKKVLYLYWIMVRLRDPSKTIKRESGEKPEQTSCCKLQFICV